MSIFGELQQLITQITESFGVSSLFGFAVTAFVSRRVGNAIEKIVKSWVSSINISNILKRYSDLRTFSENKRPPNNANKLLFLFLPPKARESVPGDLEEEFNEIILPRFGHRYARSWYWFQVLRSIAYYNGLTARIITIVETLRKSRS